MHLPVKVARVLTQGSSPTSMDFHPTQQTLLLGQFPNPVDLFVRFSLLLQALDS